MIDSLEPEPIDESFEPEMAPEPLAEPPSPRSEPDLDYDRIIGGITDRIAQAAVEYHNLQGGQPAAHDPYEEVERLMWENPAMGIRQAMDLATQNAVQAMMPYVQPVSRSFAMHQVMQGLDEEGQAFVNDFVRTKGIDPAVLNDPTVADLVRSKAELHQIRKSGRQPIPRTESAGGFPTTGLDAQTQRELAGIEKLYRSLNVKFDPSRLIRRMK